LRSEPSRTAAAGYPRKVVVLPSGETLVIFTAVHIPIQFSTGSPLRQT